MLNDFLIAKYSCLYIIVIRTSKRIDLYIFGFWANSSIKHGLLTINYVYIFLHLISFSIDIIDILYRYRTQECFCLTNWNNKDKSNSIINISYVKLIHFNVNFKSVKTIKNKFNQTGFKGDFNVWFKCFRYENVSFFQFSNSILIKYKQISSSTTLPIFVVTLLVFSLTIIFKFSNVKDKFIWIIEKTKN